MRMSRCRRFRRVPRFPDICGGWQCRGIAARQLAEPAPIRVRPPRARVLTPLHRWASHSWPRRPPGAAASAARGPWAAAAALPRFPAQKRARPARTLARPRPARCSRRRGDPAVARRPGGEVPSQEPAAGLPDHGLARRGGERVPGGAGGVDPRGAAGAGLRRAKAEGNRWGAEIGRAHV